MDYNIITDKTNIKIYEKYGTKDAGSMRHKCVLCGAHTSIDGSFSNKGHKLICKKCAGARFDSMWDVLDWIQIG